MPQQHLSLYSSALLLFLGNIRHAFGQTNASASLSCAGPRAVWAPAHAVLNNKLYIQGGQGQDLNYLGQFYALDLSVPWNSRCPVWEALPDGPRNFYHSGTATPSRRTAVLTSDMHSPPSPLSTLYCPPGESESDKTLEDQGMILTFKASADSSNLINRYDIATKSWTGSVVEVLVPRRYGIEAVTDPRSGLVYLLGGYNTWFLDSMAVYNPYSDTLVSELLSAQAGSQEAQVLGLGWFSAAWVPSMQEVLYLGGKSDNFPSRTTAMIELYSPDCDRWKSAMTSGDVPQNIDGGCLAIDAIRNQAVLFGGSGHFHDISQIFLLDLDPTLKTFFMWRQGQPAQQPRRNMACVIQGRFFVAWGGKVNNTIGEYQAPIIYDLVENQWVDRYDPNL